MEQVMFGLDTLDSLYVVTAFLFHAVLVFHFAMRKWRFESALQYGYLVYALGLPAAGVSLLLLLGGVTWSLWLGGFLYLAWAIFGYIVEYRLKIEWRSPIRWTVFGPYITLYLGTVMFYWWPLNLLWKPLWYAAAFLFIIETILNVTSHRQSLP
jgi:hypothetical protein